MCDLYSSGITLPTVCDVYVSPKVVVGCVLLQSRDRNHQDEGALDAVLMLDADTHHPNMLGSIFNRLFHVRRQTYKYYVNLYARSSDEFIL